MGCSEKLNLISDWQEITSYSRLRFRRLFLRIVLKSVKVINNKMSLFLFGFLGGSIRAVIGLIKYTQSYKDVEIKKWYFLSTILVSGLIGTICSWIVSDLGISFLGLESLPLSIALIIGYAGGDFIENIFKIVTKEPELFKLFEKEDR